MTYQKESRYYKTNRKNKQLFSCTRFPSIRSDTTTAHPPIKYIHFEATGKHVLVLIYVFDNLLMCLTQDKPQ